MQLFVWQSNNISWIFKKKKKTTVLLGNKPIYQDTYHSDIFKIASLLNNITVFIYIFLNIHTYVYFYRRNILNFNMLLPSLHS